MHLRAGLVGELLQHDRARGSGHYRFGLLHPPFRRAYGRLGIVLTKGAYIKQRLQRVGHGESHF